MKSSRFAMAAHIMAALEYHSRKGEEYVSSIVLAKSIGTNPAFVREMVCQLKEADLVVSKEGKGGGVRLARPASAIRLDEVYMSVESNQVLRHRSQPAEKSCAVSCGIRQVLDPVFGDVEASVLKTLRGRKLSDLINEMKIN